MGEAYGSKKAPDDKWADFPKRISYLIDPEGRIAKAYTVTDIPAHPEEVLNDLRAARAGLVEA